MSSPSGSSPPPLRVDGARKRFADVRALDGASFDLNAGELLGMLGPNGAGKTTAIKAIAGRLVLDEGTIELFGRRLAPREPRPEIGVVPQELAVYPKLTARENLEVFGSLYGVDGAGLRDRVAWALAWADLSERAREPVSRFSGGMLRRLNIACGLLHSPRIVLLDEPTVGVDPQSRERIYGMLAELRRSGVSIVLTTHHLEEAEQRCDRIVIIDHGRTVAAGTLGELLRRTSGLSRAVEVRLATAWPEANRPPDGLRLSPQDPHQLDGTVEDVGRDLPRLIEAVRLTGVDVEDVRVSGRTLHNVFIALTGRELRE